MICKLILNKIILFYLFESAVLCRWCTVTPSRLYQIGKWREEFEGTCLFLKSVKFSAYSLDLKDLSKFHPLVTCFYSFSIYFKTIFSSFMYLHVISFFFFIWFFFNLLQISSYTCTCLIKIVGCYGMGMEQYLGWTKWKKWIRSFKREITKV